MEDNNNNIKLLGKIFVIVFIIIFFIILISLISYVFSVDSHGNYITTTTTKKVDYSYKKLDNGTKYEYNQKLYDLIFLDSLNNGIDKKFNVLNVDLIQSEDSKFKFLYTYYVLKEKATTVTFANINDYSQKIFSTNLDEKNFIAFKDGDNYKYDINYANPQYCLKADKLKLSGDNTMLMVDLVDYSSAVCNANYLDYNETNIAHKAIITLKNNGDNYYIMTFVITE